MPFIFYLCKMGHCVSIYLIRKSDLRDQKINSILDSDKSPKINWTELNCDIFATTEIPNIKKFGENKTIAKITTDYFSGSGYQTAKLFINNKKVIDRSANGSDSSYSIMKNPINFVLEEMGVVKGNGMDEFDIIGLGKYRSNEDFK